MCEREAFATASPHRVGCWSTPQPRERRRFAQNLHGGAQQRLNALLIQLRLGGELVTAAPETAVGLLESAERELSDAVEEL